MIVLKITIEEESPGKMAFRLRGEGDATPLEFEHGEKIRETFSGLMETLMLENGNGIGRQRNGEGHGRKDA